MSQTQSPKPALRLVQGARVQTVEWSWFCGHCAAPAPGGMPPAPTARVCRVCGLGLLLETRRDSLPNDREAFLVIDSALAIQAMSRRAQALLAVSEEEAVNRPVVELLAPAEAEAQGPSQFAASIVDAAHGDDEPTTAFVRPWNTFGIRIRARIAPCGPPRAALIVLQDPHDRRLRSVS